MVNQGYDMLPYNEGSMAVMVFQKPEPIRQPEIPLTKPLDGTEMQEIENLHDSTNASSIPLLPKTIRAINEIKVLRGLVAEVQKVTIEQERLIQNVLHRDVTLSHHTLVGYLRSVLDKHLKPKPVVQQHDHVWEATYVAGTMKCRYCPELKSVPY